MQGVRRGINLRARSCTLSVGLNSASTVVRYVQGWLESASTVVSAPGARRAVGVNLRARSWRSTCKECGGSGICEHGRQRSQCKECGGSGICEHGRVRYCCKECGGSGICEHGVSALGARSAVGSQICEHGRQRSRCKECGGSQICEHDRQRHQCNGCKECGARVRWWWNLNLRARSSAVVSARSAVGLKSASTVVYAISARSAVGASTVVIGARSATDRRFPWGDGFCDTATIVHAIS